MATVKTTSFWNKPLTLLYKELQTQDTGLTDIECRKRTKINGYNELTSIANTAPFFQLLRRFKNPLVILLLVTSFVSLGLHQRHDFYIIILIVFLSITLDFYQEYSANRAAKKLQDTLALRVKVRRDNTLQSIKAKYIVPGDIVYLKAGDVVPADGRIIWENHLYVNQAILTGESFPVEKNAVDLKTTSEAELSEATNSLFMGTSIMSGDAHMLVTATGSKAYLGDIAASLRRAAPLSQFEIETKKFGFFLMKITVFLVIFVLLGNLFFARPWLDTFLFSLALAVGMTPEFLPMVMSVTLARGAKHMAKKHVIVKRLSAIHDLGGMNILCTDKTGTLTEAKIGVVGYVDAEGSSNDKVFLLAYVNSLMETGLKNPMDEAILNHKKIDLSTWTKIDEIPFDFERRRVSVLVKQNDDHLIIVKGAPEEILSQCTHYEIGGSIKTLSPEIAADILTLYKNESQKGYRILGVAWQAKEAFHDKALIDDESDLVFSGFILFYDAPKHEVKKTLQDLHQQQVKVYILTGDSEDVTQHLCAELNIPVEGLLRGKEIDQLDDQAFGNLVRTTNLYCRVTPAQKRRIVLELKSQGNVVGYMGDGINDAPSLHSANIGISVDTAADVAKEAADMILLKHNLSVIHDAIVEGRNIYSNIIKYLMMMTSSNFGNMFSMAGASVMLPFLPMLPTQILLNNLLYDTSQTAIPFDRVDPESTLAPQHWHLKLLTKFMIVMGLLSSVFDFLFFFIMYGILKVAEPLFQTGWFVESLATQILIIFVIRTRKSIFNSNPHPFLTTLALTIVALAAALPFTPLAPYLGFVQLPAYFFAILVGIVISYLAIAEKVKFWFYRKFTE